MEGPVQGEWWDDGTLFRDDNTKFTVATERSRLPDALKLAVELGRQLNQLAVYIEVTGYDGPQILRIE